LIQGKPPALPGDSRSLTIPGTSTSNQTYKKEAVTVEVMELWRNQIPLNPPFQRGKFFLPLKRGVQKEFNQGFFVCDQAPLKGQQTSSLRLCRRSGD
jgi:hypothetical protein